MGGGDGPDRAVEVAALDAFALGGGADAGQLAQDAEQQNEGAERRVGVVVNLLQAPDAGDEAMTRPARLRRAKLRMAFQAKV